MALSQTNQDAVLSWLFGTAFPAPPAQLWLALHGDETPTAGSEIKGWSGGNRIRVVTTDFGTITTASGGRQRVNTRAFIFGVHTIEQAVKSFALWDATSAGNIQLIGDVNPNGVIRISDPPVFLAGDLSLRVT
ncbi:MAG: hypothetical protein LW834_07045 [Cyanobium sp. 49614_E6]|jgi:hypothetical protein|nr:hypothetical protein [Cyanobium sp. 49614_E6]